VPGRAFSVKMVGMAEVGVPISLDGWQSIQYVGACACVIFILLNIMVNIICLVLLLTCIIYNWFPRAEYKLVLFSSLNVDCLTSEEEYWVL